MIFSSKAGPRVPRLLSIDSNEREINFDTLWDYNHYMNQDIPAGQFPTTETGQIAQFLTCMPDWMKMNQDGPNLALESLSIF